MCKEIEKNNDIIFETKSDFLDVFLEWEWFLKWKKLVLKSVRILYKKSKFSRFSHAWILQLYIKKLACLQHLTGQTCLLQFSCVHRWSRSSFVARAAAPFVVSKYLRVADRLQLVRREIGRIQSCSLCRLFEHQGAEGGSLLMPPLGQHVLELQAPPVNWIKKEVCFKIEKCPQIRLWGKTEKTIW